MKKFQLEEEDYHAIEIAKTAIRRVLKEYELTPVQIVGIGNYLFSLERLPLITPGADSYIELTYKAGNSDFWETKSFGFYMREDIFHIEVSGYRHDSAVGGDGIGYPGWYVEAEGGRDDDAILYQLEDNLAEFLNSNMKVTVEDSSEIEYDDE